MARVEIRHLVGAPARSALIAALIALPVAALAGASTLLGIVVRTTPERVHQNLGRADLRVAGAPARVQRALTQLPDGARIESLALSPEYLEVRGLKLAAALAAGQIDGLAAGILRITDGRAPRGADEVALSPVLIDVAGIQLGDRVRLATDGRDATVVGTVIDPERTTRAVIATVSTDAPVTGATTYLVALPPLADPAATAATLRDAGAQVLTATEVGDTLGLEQQLLFVLGGLGFVEAALVVAAAFAVGLRRRQREVGMLAATGAGREDVVGAILVSAGMIAIAGSLLGVAVGVGAAGLLYPYLDGWTGRLVGPFEVSPIALLAAMSMGVLTAVLAAAWPARTAARLPIRVALSGRRPPPQPSGSWVLLGVVLVALGFGLIVVARYAIGTTALLATLGGAVLGVFGCGACSPWLLEQMACVASRLPLPWRLAVRDAGRFRSRNGPVVTAILAGMALSVTVAAALASIGEGDGGWTTLRDDQLRVNGPAAAEAGRRIAAALPVEARAPLRAAYLEGEPIRARVVGSQEHGWVAIGDAGLLDTLGATVAEPTTDGQIAAVALDAFGADAELVTRDWRIFATATAVDRRADVAVPGLAFVLAETELTRHGLTAGPAPGSSSASWLLRLAGPLTKPQLERARSIATELAGTSVDAGLLHRSAPRLMYSIGLLLSLVTGLLVLGVATALTAVESRNDQVILATVGAAPSLSRAHAAARAGYLGLLGCLLAVPAGLLPAFGIMTSVASVTFVVPWTEIVVTALLLPAVAYLGAWCLTRPARWARPA